jgi:saccharopine dehydrogenase-like NADP-dependent oxidoreductase
VSVNAKKGTVLVLGGSGFYGRYLVDDLLQHSKCHIIVASRTPSLHPGWDGRVETAICDRQDRRRLEELLVRCQVVVHCAGPFHGLPIKPLQAALATGAHYVDIAEERQFARAVRGLEGEIQAAGITALSGISVAPAMEALFAAMLAPLLDKITSIRTFAAPDTRKHRGQAMFHTMLVGVGRPFFQPRQGERVQVHGWTEAEWVDFPPPLGRRLTYLVLEMADLDWLPELFGAQTVEFKAGTEHSWLNRLLGLAATIRVKTGHPRWERSVSHRLSGPLPGWPAALVRMKAVSSLRSAVLKTTRQSPTAWPWSPTGTAV